MATIVPITGAGKIKDEYVNINTSLTNLNNGKLEKSGDTMTGMLTMDATANTANSSSQPIRFGYVDSGGTKRFDRLLEVSSEGKLVFTQLGLANYELWHGGNNPASLAVPGYQRLASGLILQWGGTALASGSRVTFPLAFPTILTCVVLTMSTDDYGYHTAGDTTGFNLGHHGGASALPFSWLAIGY